MCPEISALTYGFTEYLLFIEMLVVVVGAREINGLAGMSAPDNEVKVPNWKRIGQVMIGVQQDISINHSVCCTVNR